MKDVTRRFETIDVLRGVSIVAVVLLHTTIRFSSRKVTLWGTMPPWLYHLLFQQGGNGVTIFFAISGFLITLTSIRRFGGLERMRPGVFYRIRFARIGPTLLLLLAVLSALHLAGVNGYVINPQRETLLGALASALTFTLNYYEAVHGWLPAVWTVLWSLSIEEMFYLFFPLTCLLMRWRHGIWVWVSVLLAFVVMCPFARTVWTKNEIWQENTYVGGMGLIAMGCLTALVVVRLERQELGQWLLRGVQAVGILLMAWMMYWPRWEWLHPVMHWLGVSGVDDLVLALGACLVMVGSVLRTRASGSRALVPLRWFGRHSYEVYLTHEFLVIAGVELFGWMRVRHGTGPLWVWFAGILLSTAPLGWLVGRFFSEPLNRRLRPGGLDGERKAYPGG